MNIFFDHQTFTQQKFGGISRYYCEIVKGINETKNNKAHISLLWSDNENLSAYNLKFPNLLFPNKHRFTNLTNSIFNKIDISVGRYDVYHATYFDTFLFNYKKKIPLITTFYDMIYEKLSHKFSELREDSFLIEQKRKIAEKADHLIAISESTKKDMIELLNVNPDKISVIYLASPFLASDFTSKCQENQPPYLLFVGKREGYKNFITLISSIKNILIKYNIQLICAGGGNFSSKENQYIKSLELNSLVYYKAIDDTQLKELYENALAFVFPSLYEGFGIPILEAFSCSCPCILSNYSSLPEVAGDAAHYFDPYSEESISEVIEDVILSETVREEMIKKGRERLAFYSWQKTVDQTIQVYQQFT